MSLDTWEIDGYDDHIICGAPGCSACDLFKRIGETEDQWTARIRALWNAPDARPVLGPARADGPTCRNGHLWADDNERTQGNGARYCRQCNIDGKRAWRRKKRVASQMVGGAA